MKIIKRNGSEADFDLNKIVVAVSKANAACRKEELTQSQIVEIAEYVEFKMSKANRAFGRGDTRYSRKSDYGTGCI